MSGLPEPGVKLICCGAVMIQHLIRSNFGKQSENLLRCSFLVPISRILACRWNFISLLRNLAIFSAAYKIQRIVSVWKDKLFLVAKRLTHFRSNQQVIAHFATFPICDKLLDKGLQLRYFGPQILTISRQ